MRKSIKEGRQSAGIRKENTIEKNHREKTMPLIVETHWHERGDNRYTLRLLKKASAVTRVTDKRTREAFGI